MPTIIFNGRTYNSIEEMPVSERQAYTQIASMLVDKDGNGIPDFLEGDVVKNVMTAFTSSVHINGQTYDGMNDLPPEVLAKVQGAFTKMSELGIVAKMPPVMTQVSGVSIEPKPVMSSTPIISNTTNASIQEEKSSPMVWVLIGMGIMLCLALVAVGIFFLISG